MRFRTIAAIALAIAFAVPALAQDEAGPIVWVAYSRTKPGKTQDWVQAGLKFDKPLMDKLMADGTVMSWGYATPINHRPGFAWNVLTWVSVADWAGVGTWAGAAMQAMQARSAEETQQAEEAMAAVEEAGSHFDEVVREAYLSSSEKPFAYFYVSHFRANPGHFDDATQLYKDVVVPVADKLKADGVVAGYGLHVQELHGQHQPDEKPWTHRAWYALPNLAANDALQAALDAAMTPERQKRRAEIFDPKGHRDDILMVLHLGAPPTE